MVASNLGGVFAGLAGLVGIVTATGHGALHNIIDSAWDNKLYQYPTDFTRGIIPKALHSHNDYWRDVPYYSALSHGAISVEADVWLINSTLYVGHEESALSHARTFDALYIQPILDTLRRTNPVTPFATEPTTNGVYDAAADQTLYLFVDLKTDGPSTWRVVQDALKPLLDANYLTTYDGAELSSGPVTVVGTGNTPLALIQADSASTAKPRFAFYDAHLPQLASTEANVTRFEAPIASTDFMAAIGGTKDGSLNETQRDALRSQIDEAHEKGIMARYWNLPGWPVGTRNAVWKELWNVGVDLINVDDLQGASDFWSSA